MNQLAIKKRVRNPNSKYRLFGLFYEDTSDLWIEYMGAGGSFFTLEVVEDTKLQRL